ncbi:MAG TPA: protoheme IX farnesyltransferase [Myxococcales bacterium]|nr:protoheme IX farnesyltransferase [Myxococcales bacterium]
MVASAQQSAQSSSAFSRQSLMQRFVAYLELGKPNLSALVVITGITGYYVATPHIVSWRFFHFVSGLFLTALGACAINMVIERDIDAKMQRTAGRPIPSGRVSVRGALIFTWTTFILGFAQLAYFVNHTTAALALLTLVTYAWAYTPLKKMGPVSTWVGAIPGAIPPLMGWTAVRNSFEAPGLILFAILFFWQLPHFLALAWMYREDYQRVGYKMLPGKENSIKIAGLEMTLCCLALIKVSILLTMNGAAGGLYMISAVVLGGFFLAFALRVIYLQTIRSARHLFLASIIYLPLLLTAIVVDRLV